MKAKTRLLALVLCFVCLLCACNTQNNVSSSQIVENKQTLTPLYIYLRGNVGNMDTILAQFEKRTAQTLGIQLIIKGISNENYNQTINALIASGTPVDLVVNAPGQAFNQAVLAGDYADLTEDLASGTLHEVFGEDILLANSYNGKNYALPLLGMYDNPSGIIYRLDLLRHYTTNIEAIVNPNTLQSYTKAVQGMATSYVPLMSGEQGFSSANFNTQALVQNNIYPLPGTDYTALPAAVVLSADGKSVDNVVFAGDAPAIFKNLRNGAWNFAYRYDFLTEALTKNTALASFDKEPALVNNRFAQTLFTQNKAAAYVSTAQADFYSMETALRLEEPRAQVAFYSFNPSYTQNIIQPHSIPSNLQATWLLSIPSTSQRKNEALAFLTWLYESNLNYDLFAYGISGTDWQASSDGTYTALKSSTPYPSNQLANFVGYTRKPSKMARNMGELYDNLTNPEYYTRAPLAGCQIENSLTYQHINALYAQIMPGVNAGIYGEQTAQILAQTHEKAMQAGLDILREDIKTQVQHWLDTTTPQEEPQE